MGSDSDAAASGAGDGPLAPSVRPPTLLLTFLGEAVLRRDIAVFSGTYIAVMAGVGTSEQATRSTLSRMVRHGLLTRHRHGRRVYLGLTAHAVSVLTEGEQRIWGTGAVNNDPEQRWTLLSFSLPESRRDERHLLRSRLRWAGFGLLRSGLWIAPRTVDVDALWSDPRLREHVVAFHAQPVAPEDTVQLVRDAYDLPAIAARYQRFLARWDTPEPLPTAPNDLARLLWLVSEWLLLLRDDPQIPLRDLPDHWPAVAAEQVFTDRYAQLRPRARPVLDRLLDAIDVPAPDAAP